MDLNTTKQQRQITTSHWRYEQQQCSVYNSFDGLNEGRTQCLRGHVTWYSLVTVFSIIILFPLYLFPSSLIWNQNRVWYAQQNMLCCHPVTYGLALCIIYLLTNTKLVIPPVVEDFGAGCNHLSHLACNSNGNETIRYYMLQIIVSN